MAGLHASRKPKTESFYATHLNQMRLWAEEHDIALADFRARHMRQYMALRADQVAVRTQLHDVNCCRVFFRFCHRNGYSDVNVLGDYEVPRPPKSSVRCPSQEQLDQLLKAIQNRWDPAQNPRARYLDKNMRHFLRSRDYAMVTFLIETGCRLGEACGVALVDLVRDPKTLTAGRAQVTFRGTKNGEDRTVPVSRELITAMQPWLTLRDRIERDAEGDTARGADRRCKPNLFLTQHGEDVDVAGWGKAFRGYLAFGGIEHFTRHAIRHFTVTQIAQHSVLSAQQIAGHKSLAVTQGYLHPNEEQIRADHADVAPLGNILSSKRAAAARVRRQKMF